VPKEKSRQKNRGKAAVEKHGEKQREDESKKA